MKIYNTTVLKITITIITITTTTMIIQTPNLNHLVKNGLPNVYY
jgi:hypothetical protein